MLVDCVFDFYMQNFFQRSSSFVCQKLTQTVPNWLEKCVSWSSQHTCLADNPPVIESWTLSTAQINGSW